MAEQNNSSLPAVRSILAGKKSGDTLALSAADFPAAQWPLVNNTLSAVFGPATPLSLKLPSAADLPQPTAAGLVVAATLAAPLLGAPGLSLQFIFEDNAAGANLRLSAAGFPATWKPAQAFAEFKNSLLDEFDYSQVAVSVDANLLPATAADPGFGLTAASTVGDAPPKINVRYGLQGNLGFGKAEGVPWLLGMKQVFVKGTIDATPQGPVAQLVSFDAGGQAPAFFSSDNLKLFGAAPKYAFKVLGGYVPKPKGSPTSVYRVLGAAAAADGLPANIKAYYGLFRSLSDPLVDLHGLFDYTAFGSDFQDPAAKQYLNSVTTAVPADSLPITQLRPDNFGTVYDVSAKKTQYQYYILAVDGLYTPLGNWLKFHDIRLGLSTGFEGGQQYVMAATKADIFEKTFDASVSFPDLNMALAMQEGESIDIAALLKQLSIQIPGVTNTQCNVFSLLGDAPNKAFSVTVGLKDLWSIDFGNTKLSVDKALFTLGYDGGPWGSIAAECTLASLVFDMQAAYDQSKTWSFGLSVQPDQPPPDLKKLQDHIGQNFSVPAASGALDTNQFEFRSLNVFFSIADTQTNVRFDFAGALHFSEVDIDFSIHFMLTEKNG